jgi:antimicrobial peptide system SdpB family protein
MKKSQLNLYGPLLGLGRSLLALGNLLTILCSSTFVLFPPYSFTDKQHAATGIEKINLFYLFPYKYIFIPEIIAILILVVTIIGYFPKITAILQAWVSLSLFSSLLIVEGGDQITQILSILLIPIMLFDKRKNHWEMTSNQPDKNTPSGYFLYWSYLFIQLQMSLLYLDAAVEKIKVPEWKDGSAVYYWVNHNLFGAPDFLDRPINLFLSSNTAMTFTTWGVMILELLLFAALFMKQEYKNRLFVAAVFFHFLIFIIHGLPTFGLAMTGGLILYLLPLNNTIKIKFRERILFRKVEIA